jgi:hypothetical protein
MRFELEPLYDAKALATEVEMFHEVSKKWKEIE